MKPKRARLSLKPTNCAMLLTVFATEFRKVERALRQAATVEVASTKPDGFCSDAASSSSRKITRSRRFSATKPSVLHSHPMRALLSLQLLEHTPVQTAPSSAVLLSASPLMSTTLLPCPFRGITSATLAAFIRETVLTDAPLMVLCQAPNEHLPVDKSVCQARRVLTAMPQNEPEAQPYLSAERLPSALAPTSRLIHSHQSDPHDARRARPARRQPRLPTRPRGTSHAPSQSPCLPCIARVACWCFHPDWTPRQRPIKSDGHLCQTKPFSSLRMRPAPSVSHRNPLPSPWPLVFCD